MSEVRHLKAVEPKPDKDMVAALEKLVERAKAGEFLAIGFVAQLTERQGIATCYSRGEGSNVWTLLGAMRELEARLLKLTDDT